MLGKARQLIENFLQGALAALFLKLRKRPVSDDVSVVEHDGCGKHLLLRDG